MPVLQPKDINRIEILIKMAGKNILDALSTIKEIKRQK